MRVARRHMARLLLLMLAVALVGSACGSDDDGASAGSDADDGTSEVAEGGIDYAELSGTIDGSGASFPDAFYQHVIGVFAEDAPDLIVNYNAVGSGQGKKDFAAELNDFAGTDSLVKPEEAKAGSYLYFPTAAAPITVAYKLDGVDKLQLSADTIAKIFQGEIKTWNDSAIKADNPGATLPSTAIVVARRADGSGTTHNFTKYLVKAAPAVWKLGSGDTVNWPASTQAGNKNTGVAQIVQSTNGAIGYVDYADAKASKLRFAAVKNKAGKFVIATLDGASDALAGAVVNDDLTLDPIDADGDAAYPITAATYMLLRPSYDTEAGEAVKGFLHYLLTKGQEEAAAADFARLPAELAEKALDQLDDVRVG